MSLERIRAFLEAGEEVEFKARNREEGYWQLRYQDLNGVGEAEPGGGDSIAGTVPAYISTHT
jgi:hypothetical protein